MRAKSYADHPRRSPGGHKGEDSRDAGIDQKEIDDYLARAIASDYDNLLKVSMETVDVSFS